MLSRVKHQIGEFLPALRSHNYRLYFVGQGISLVGTWLQNIAEAWLIYPVLTTNRSLLGIVSAINLLPHVALVLFAGVLAECFNKSRALIIQQLLYASFALVMFLLVYTKTVQVWQVMVAAFAFGTVFAFEMPTRQSLMLTLVNKSDYPSAISLNAAIFNAARAIGPALAGLAIATIGIAPAYLVNSLSFFAVIVAVALMRLPKQENQVRTASLKAEFMAGWSYIIQHKVIAVLLALLFLLTLFAQPLATLLPVFAHDIFAKGEVGFGLLQAAFGLGALTGALSFNTLFQKFSHKYRLLQFTLTAVFLTMVAFAFSPRFFLSLLIQIMSGWAVVSTIAYCNTVIQMNTPDHLRSRMLSFYSFVLIGGMPFGALFASIGVATLGARLTVLAASLLFVLTSTGLIATTKGKFQEKLQLLYNTGRI